MSALGRPNVEAEPSRDVPRTAGPAATLAPTRAVSPGTRELLAWVARVPRTYAETMRAWQSSCPRHTVWEDALADGLVQLDGSGARTTAQTRVTLTPLGRTILDGA